MLSSLLLLAALQGAPAATPPRVPSPPRGTPVWLRRPSEEDLERYFPHGAAQARVAGRVAMSCRALASGELTDCTVASEAPPGYGFGAAALQMAPLFRLEPRMTDGSSVEGIGLRLPLHFTMPPPPPPRSPR